MLRARKPGAVVARHPADAVVGDQHHRCALALQRCASRMRSASHGRRCTRWSALLRVCASPQGRFGRVFGCDEAERRSGCSASAPCPCARCPRCGRPVVHLGARTLVAGGPGLEHVDWLDSRSLPFFPAPLFRHLAVRPYGSPLYVAADAATIAALDPAHRTTMGIVHAAATASRGVVRLPAARPSLAPASALRGRPPRRPCRRAAVQ